MSQSTIWVLAAVLAAAAAILGATSGEAIFAVAFGFAALMFLAAAFRPPRGSGQR
jgi:hypothetical protein